MTEEFETYREITRYQRSVIDALDINFISFIQQIQSLIQANKLGILEEGMIEMGCDRFCFKRDGKIIFVDPKYVTRRQSFIYKYTFMFV